MRTRAIAGKMWTTRFSHRSWSGLIGRGRLVTTATSMTPIVEMLQRRRKWIERRMFA
jgi:hypothetical protein